MKKRNLNFRSYIKRLSRRTICFSKNEKIYCNGIGMHINHYYLESGRYSASV
ncbi:MAG: IS1 family transposase [Candidatus Electronema sp. VV]